MSELVVIGYDNEFRADEVRLQLLKMQKDYLLDLEDAVVAVKSADGRVKLHQSYPLPAAGAVGGGFWGLLSGTVASVAMWGWVKMDPSAIRYIALSPNAKDMAENMYRALWSWLICVIVTVVVSLLTEPKPEKELAGLVYGCTEIPSEAQVPMYQRPMFWAVIVLVVFLILQIMFW